MRIFAQKVTVLIALTALLFGLAAAGCVKKRASGGEKQGGQMQGMEGMPGMPGMKPGGETQGAQTNEFTVPVERQQQIGVTYATVTRKPLHHTIRSVGMVGPDKGRNWQFVSRVDGYVQKLDVKSPGEIVEKDAPLYRSIARTCSPASASLLSCCE